MQFIIKQKAYEKQKKKAIQNTNNVSVKGLKGNETNVHCNAVLHFDAK